MAVEAVGAGDAVAADRARAEKQVRATAAMSWLTKVGPRPRVSLHPAASRRPVVEVVPATPVVLLALVPGVVAEALVLGEVAVAPVLGVVVEAVALPLG